LSLGVAYDELRRLVELLEPPADIEGTVRAALREANDLPALEVVIVTAANACLLNRNEASLQAAEAIICAADQLQTSNGEALAWVAGMAWNLGFASAAERLARRALDHIHTRWHAHHECHQILGLIESDRQEIESASAHLLASIELDESIEASLYPFNLRQDLVTRLATDAKGINASVRYCRSCFSWIAKRGGLAIDGREAASAVSGWGDPGFFADLMFRLAQPDSNEGPQ
jgi:hypothetical protein